MSRKLIYINAHRSELWELIWVNNGSWVFILDIVLFADMHFEKLFLADFFPTRAVQDLKLEPVEGGLAGPGAVVLLDLEERGWSRFLRRLRSDLTRLFRVFTLFKERDKIVSRTGL